MRGGGVDDDLLTANVHAAIQLLLTSANRFQRAAHAGRRIHREQLSAGKLTFLSIKFHYRSADITPGDCSLTVLSPYSSCLAVIQIQSHANAIYKIIFKSQEQRD